MIEPWQLVCIVVGVLLIGNNVATDKYASIREALAPLQRWIRLVGLALIVFAAIPELCAML